MQANILNNCTGNILEFYRKLKQIKSYRLQYGKNARKYVDLNFSKEKILNQFKKLL